MDRYLVTNKQFQRFVKETGYITFAEKPPEAVGSYPANGYGLYDMIGNVWEWTQDWYREKHLENPTKACCTPKNPKGGKEIDSYDCRLSPSMRKPRKVLKGGSFLCAPNYCARYRPAARHPEDTDTSTNHIGFRTIFCPSVTPEQG
jgi:formylglycine-generating enzyme required for sulfatase activity